MNFAPSNAHTTPLFKNCNILKFADIMNVESRADWIIIYIYNDTVRIQENTDQK